MTTKRAKTVTTHTHKDGSKVYRVRFVAGGKDSSETFAVRAEAERFAQLIVVFGPAGALDQLDSESEVAGIPTLNELADMHIDLLTDASDGTKARYRGMWARTYGKSLGYLPANCVTADRYSAALIELAKVYSHKSLKNQRGLLSAVCNRAIRDGYLSVSPTAGIKLPRGDEAERVEMHILTVAEFERLSAAIRPHYRAMLRFMWGTGARWGEVVALQIGDLDLSMPTVHIQRGLKVGGPGVPREVGNTKTKRSNRTIYLPPQLVPDLAALIAGRETQKTALVFRAARGGMVQHRTFWSDIWLPALGKADLLDPRPRIHDLRHSHASWLLNQGVPMEVVQARLGHESIKTTMDTYYHCRPDIAAAAAHAAAMAFAPSPLTIEVAA